jgi:hypothetical protein
MPTIRADCDLGALRDRVTILRMALDTRDTAIFHQDLLNCESLTHLRTCISRGVDE